MGTGFSILHLFRSIAEAGIPIRSFLIDYGIVWFPLAFALTVNQNTRRTGLMMAAGLGFDVTFCDGILKHLAVQNPYTGSWMWMGARFRLPSGSAAGAFTALTALCYSGESRFWKAVLAAACVIVLSGNHALSPTDIAGGMAAGAVFGYVGCKAVEGLERYGEKRKMKT